MGDNTESTGKLSPEYVRRIAELARLEIPDDKVGFYADRLGAVLEYAKRLSEVDTTGIEPMSHPHDVSNRLRDDEPGPTLPRETFMAMAPETVEPFVKIPKVIGDGGGA
jgi:aspartyl-tRNA(Asn)/glutamyl-tRNA(Gln) amidotransferase subunit C